MVRKLLLIAADQARLGSTGAHTLKAEHLEIIHRAVEGNLDIVVATPEEANIRYASAEIIAAFPQRMPQISELPQARWLHSFSAGVDKILTPDLKRSDVLLTNSSGVHAVPIAETILAYLLMFARGFTKTMREQTQKVWRPNNASTEIRNSTVLIVGLGAIGDETAKLLHALGAKILATSRSAKHKPAYVERLETTEGLDEMLPQADYVVITLPHTSETRNMFDKRRLNAMKKSAVIVNIGRGGIINERDLHDALNNGEIAGAALDVFETEPLPYTSPLWDKQNVIITPHHSGLSLRYMDRAIDVLSLNIASYLKGERLPNLVDKNLGY